jgi:hypothetical protein
MAIRDNLNPKNRKSVKALRKQINTGHGKPPRETRWAGEISCPPGTFSCWKGGMSPDGTVEQQGDHGNMHAWGSWECCDRRGRVHKSGGKVSGRVKPKKYGMGGRAGMNTPSQHYTMNCDPGQYQCKLIDPTGQMCSGWDGQYGEGQPDEEGHGHGVRQCWYWACCDRRIHKKGGRVRRNRRR